MKLAECLTRIGLNSDDFIKSYAVVSVDDDNQKVVVDVELPVIKFDAVSDYHRSCKGYKQKYKSNDALFVDDDNKLYFIEFKSGHPDSADLRVKSSESLLVAMDMGLIENLQDSQKNVEYFLVTSDNALERLHSLAGKGHATWGGIGSQNWLYKAVHAYTPREFKKWFLQKYYPDYQM